MEQVSLRGIRKSCGKVEAGQTVGLEPDTHWALVFGADGRRV